MRLLSRLVLPPDERILVVFLVPGWAAGKDPSFVWSLSVGAPVVSLTGETTTEREREREHLVFSC